jgi:hypothetical protein
MSYSRPDPFITIAVRVPADLVERIDHAAKIEGKRRAEHVRDMLAWLHQVDPPEPIKRRPPWQL